jgi:hypothetical protein
MGVRGIAEALAWDAGRALRFAVIPPRLARARAARVASIETSLSRVALTWAGCPQLLVKPKAHSCWSSGLRRGSVPSVAGGWAVALASDGRGPAMQRRRVSRAVAAVLRSDVCQELGLGGTFHEQNHRRGWGGGKLAQFRWWDRTGWRRGSRGPLSTAVLELAVPRVEGGRHRQRPVEALEANQNLRLPK